MKKNSHLCKQNHAIYDVLSRRRQLLRSYKLTKNSPVTAQRRTYKRGDPA